MSSRQKVASTALICAAILCNTQALGAEAKPNKKQFSTVTVYATKGEQDTFDVPGMVDVIDSDSPGYRSASTASDLLKFTPAVEFSGGPRRNGQSPSIRGFDDNQIIVLMDGRRQNFEGAHDGRFFVDPNLLKRVEVVKGASSAIYGAGAIGGVMAFETKDAADFLRDGETLGAMVSYGYRSANKEISPSFTTYAKSGAWDILGNISYRDSDRIKQGDGNKLQASDHFTSGLAKIAYSVDSFSKIKFQYQGSHNNSIEPNNGQILSNTSDNLLVNKFVNDDQFSLKYEYDNPNDNLVKLKTHLYHNQTEVNEDDLTAGQAGSALGRITNRTIETTGFNLENRSSLKLSDKHKHDFTYGGEYYRNEQSGYRNRALPLSGGGSAASEAPGAPDATQDVHGLFVQDEIAIKSSIGDFLLTPAVRYDSYESKDKIGNSQQEDHFSPKFAGSYKPFKNLMLFGSYSQAFRAPNMTELYAVGQHIPAVVITPPGITVFPQNFFIPNPNLKPEVVNTLEVGAGLDFDNIVADNDRFTVKGSYHNSEGKNFISQMINFGSAGFSPVAGSTMFYNVARAKITGFEVETAYQTKTLGLKLGLSEVTAKDDRTGQYLVNSLPLTLVSDVSYKFDSIDSIFGFRSRFAQKNKKVYVNPSSIGTVGTNATAGYSVHNIYYRWAPTAKSLENFSLDLGIDNIFDKSYQRVFTSLREEGRSYWAKGTLKF
jgi:hemoglobin/transferrin/lactoferrin receptor protein